VTVAAGASPSIAGSDVVSRSDSGGAIAPAAALAAPGPSGVSLPEIAPPAHAATAASNIKAHDAAIQVVSSQFSPLEATGLWELAYAQSQQRPASRNELAREALDAMLARMGS
jgi:hypothetical protein